jgi:hypothetical protein
VAALRMGRHAGLPLQPPNLELLPQLALFRTTARWERRSPDRQNGRNWVCLTRLAPRLPPGKLALFCRGLSNVLFTITPFPPSTCPSFCSGGNWLCLYSRLWPRGEAGGPRRGGGLPGPAGNWVCLAHWPAVPRLWGLVPPGFARQLGLFCSLGREEHVAQSPSAGVRGSPPGAGRAPKRSLFAFGVPVLHAFLSPFSSSKSSIIIHQS